MSTENENEVVETEETEVDESGLLDAISEGIDEVSPHIEDDDDDDAQKPADDAGTTEGESEPEGEADNEPTDDEPADGSGTEDGAAEGDGDGDSDESDDGSDGDGEGEGEGDAVSGKPEGEPDGDENADDATEPDHINDPIAEGTNEKTAERIKGLIDIAKEQTARAEQGDEVIAAITGVGCDPEQFTNTLGFLQLYNSKDPVQRKQALEVARGVVHELSIELGEGSADLLAKHDDLAAEVEEGTLTQKRAVEIATQRERQALQTSRTEHQQQKDDDEAEGNRLMQLGKDQLTAFENENKSDPAYEALYPTFRGILADTLKGGVHPDRWKETAQRIYNRLKANYTPAPTPDPVPPKKQPRRAKQVAGGGGGGKKPEPQSAVEAVNDALGGL